ncbi:MAG TPA: hypothetical protein VEN82_04650, partial [Actinomycetota bacterium]|nr:hypothetical protein [Actinomycetota bacterium]
TSLSVGEGGSRLSLPVVPFEERPRPTFLPAAPPAEPPGWSSGGEILPGRLVVEREGGVARARWSGGGWSEAPWGRSEYDERLWWEVADDRPGSAAAGGSSVTTVHLPDRTIAWRGTLEIRSDGEAFHYSYRRQLEVNGALIRERRWQESVPRDHQ